MEELEGEDDEDEDDALATTFFGVDSFEDDALATTFFGVDSFALAATAVGTAGAEALAGAAGLAELDAATGLLFATPGLAKAALATLDAALATTFFAVAFPLAFALATTAVGNAEAEALAGAAGLAELDAPTGGLFATPGCGSSGKVKAPSNGNNSFMCFPYRHAASKKHKSTILLFLLSRAS